MIFTDERGRPIGPNGRPVLPGQLLEAAAERLGIPEGRWSHPTGEPLDAAWVSFNEPALAGKTG